MSRKSRRRAAARNAVQNRAVVNPVVVNPGQNNMPVPTQNMQQQSPSPIFQQRPQFMPPLQDQSLQTSPLNKSQQKIADAKFPAARAWWEGVKSAFGGQPEEVQQFSNVSPEQLNVLRYLMALGGYELNNPYEGFEPIAQQAQNEFNQQTVPSLAERFTSLGNSSISSPAFASQLGQAGAGLQQNLAALRSDYGQQNKNQALQMLQLGLNPYTENVYRPATPGLGRQFINAGAQALPLLL